MLASDSASQACFMECSYRERHRGANLSQILYAGSSDSLDGISKSRVEQHRLSYAVQARFWGSIDSQHARLLASAIVHNRRSSDVAWSSKARVSELRYVMCYVSPNLGIHWEPGGANLIKVQKKAKLHTTSV